MKAFELLSSPDRWTKETSARTKDGYVTDAKATDAFSFCTLGALYRCYGIERLDSVVEAVEARIRKSIPGWNDDPQRTWEEVVAVLKELDL